MLFYFLRHLRLYGCSGGLHGQLFRDTCGLFCTKTNSPQVSRSTAPGSPCKSRAATDVGQDIAFIENHGFSWNSMFFHNIWLFYETIWKNMCFMDFHEIPCLFNEIVMINDFSIVYILGGGYPWPQNKGTPLHLTWCMGSAVRGYPPAALWAPIAPGWEQIHHPSAPGPGDPHGNTGTPHAVTQGYSNTASTNMSYKNSHLRIKIMNVL